MKVQELNLASINTTSRVRRDFGDIAALARSLKQHGQLSPIVIDTEGKLLAGFRRMTAAKQLGWETIKAVVYEGDHSPEVIELVENMQREDFSWQEKAEGLLALHKKMTAENPEHTMADLARVLGLSTKSVSLYLDIADNDSKVKQQLYAQSTLSKANYAKRLIRQKDKADIARELATEKHDDLPITLDTSSLKVEKPQKPIKVAYAEQADFTEWAQHYAGTPYDFIHCDFPYGVGMDKGLYHVQGQRYKDDMDTFFDLTQALTLNIDKLLLPIGHIIFWFSMNYYSETLDFLKKIPGMDWDPHPLVWSRVTTHTLPKNGVWPRHGYETAFFGARGEARLKSSPSNIITFAKPRQTTHMSEKPPSVLQLWFKDIVDEKTRFLDPTCGGGSALLVAKQLGAAEVMGLDVDQQFVEMADERLESNESFLQLPESIEL